MLHFFIIKYIAYKKKLQSTTTNDSEKQKLI